MEQKRRKVPSSAGQTGPETVKKQPGNGNRDDSFQVKPDGTTGIFDVVLEQDQPGMSR